MSPALQSVSLLCLQLRYVSPTAKCSSCVFPELWRVDLVVLKHQKVTLWSVSSTPVCMSPALWRVDLTCLRHQIDFDPVCLHHFEQLIQRVSNTKLILILYVSAALNSWFTCLQRHIDFDPVCIRYCKLYKPPIHYFSCWLVLQCDLCLQHFENLYILENLCGISCYYPINHPLRQRGFLFVENPKDMFLPCLIPLNRKMCK